MCTNRDGSFSLIYRFATTSLCEQLRVHWRESSDFCYVLPRGEGVRPLSTSGLVGGARTIVRAYRTLYPDAAPAQACVTADTVIVGRASGRAYNMYNGRVVGGDRIHAILLTSVWCV